VKPGRELDQLIAEKVFGKKTYLAFPPQCPECGAQVPDDYFHFVHRRMTHQDGNRVCLAGHLLQGTPHYSYRIEDAWEIVKIFTRADLVRGPDLKWCVMFRGIPDRVFADTAPHAICLAALKVIGSN
jgi:hypothetical protein